MLAEREEGEIRAGCGGDMRACWKVDISRRSKRGGSESGSVRAHTRNVHVAAAACRVFHSPPGLCVRVCECECINKAASPSCAFTPVWSICSNNNLLLSKRVSCKCIKCTISTDVSSWTHNHIIMNAVTGKCFPLYQLALALHYLTLIVLFEVKQSISPHASTNYSLNGWFQSKANFPFWYFPKQD